MIDGKYSAYTPPQLDDCKKRLHKLIHWILRYKDDGDEVTLRQYFPIVQFKLAGYNEVLNRPKELLNVMALIESARLENEKGADYNHKQFRSAILDAHDCIDKIGE